MDEKLKDPELDFLLSLDDDELDALMGSIMDAAEYYDSLDEEDMLCAW